MRRAVKIAIWAIVSIGLGIASAFWVVSGSFGRATVSIGPWQTNPLIGSQTADPYVRAAVARNGLLALNRSETVYYTANRDSDGDRLTGRCAYSVVGTALPARWWSLTVYGADQFLVPNANDRYAYGGGDLMAGGAAVFRLVLASEALDDPWLAVPEEGPFSVTLRLYNPEPRVVAALDAIDLPEIEKIGCAP